MQFDSEARRLIDWSGRSTISYREYLQNREYERSNRYAISEQTAALVATQQELAKYHYQIAETQAESLSEIGSGIETMHDRLAEVVDSLSDVRTAITDGANQVQSAIYWGFSRTFALLGKVNDQLSELIAISRTPSQTWSYEQFDIARDEIRRGLYPEALESVTRAIDGFGSNAGYKTDFRSHFLLGQIRLGDFDNHAEAVVDPARAEQAFLASARYGRSDDPLAAGNAFIWAGRAALADNRPAEAFAHTRDGVALARGHSQGHYQLARLQLARGDAADAADSLATAIVLNAQIALSAAESSDAHDHPDWFPAAAGLAKERLKRLNSYLIDRLAIYTGVLSGSVPLGSSLGDLFPELSAETGELVSEAERAAKTGTLTGLDVAAARYLATELPITAMIIEYDDAARKLVDREVERRAAAMAAPHSALADLTGDGSPEQDSAQEVENLKNMRTWGCAGTLGLFMIVSLYSCTQTAGAARSSSGFVGLLILVGIAIPIIVAILIANSENRLREIVSDRSERAEELRAEIAQLTGRRDALVSERREFSYPLVHQLNLWSDLQEVRIAIAAGKEVPAHDRNVGARRAIPDSDYAVSLARRYKNLRRRPEAVRVLQRFQGGGLTDLMSFYDGL